MGLLGLQIQRLAPVLSTNVVADNL
jgi:hypothetical protein